MDARGDVSLVDGVSGAVLSSVTATEVAEEAQSATVVNGENAGYVTFPASGRVLGLDSRTFQASHRVKFSTPGDRGLRMLVSDEQVFVVAGDQHTMTPVAGHSLDTLGAPVVFRGSPDRLVMTPKGVVWGLGSGLDRLIRYGRGATIQGGPDPGPSSRRLLIAGGAPVAADPGGGMLVRFDRATGRADDRLSCLGLPSGGEVDFVGADDSPQVVALTHGANNLVAVADFQQHRCVGLIRLDAPGADPAVYGTPALLDGKVYVPDRTAGQLVVIDLAQASSQRIPLPVGADQDLRVFTHDGLVWFDVTGGNQAGTVTHDLQLININKQPPTTPQAPPDTANPTPATTTTTTIANSSIVAPPGGVNSTDPSTTAASGAVTRQRPPTTRPPITVIERPPPTPVVDTGPRLPQPQTIGFPPPGGGTVKYADGLIIPLGATATSGLPIAYSGFSGSCTGSGNSVALTGAGSCSVTANQGGNQQFAAAAPVQANFTIVKGDSNFGIQAPNTVTVNPSGLSITNIVGAGSSCIGTACEQTFNLSWAGPCLAFVSMGHIFVEVGFSAPGTCTVTVDQNGDQNFNSGPRRSASITYAPTTVPPPPPTTIPPPPPTTVPPPPPTTVPPPPPTTIPSPPPT